MKCEWCGEEFPRKTGRFCGTCQRPAGKRPEWKPRAETGLHVEVRDGVVILKAGDGMMVQIWELRGRAILTRRTWGGRSRRLTAREILMLREDVRQALLRGYQGAGADNEGGTDG